MFNPERASRYHVKRDNAMDFRRFCILAVPLMGSLGPFASVGFATPVLVSPASFSCNTQNLIPTENAICRDNTLASDDRMLTAVYRATLENASPAERVKLQEAQSAWLMRRNQCGTNWDCIDQDYRERIDVIQRPPAPYTDHVPPNNSIPPLLVGTWDAAIGPNGETIRITKTTIDRSRYQVLAIRPERGRGYRRDPMYVVTLRVGSTGGFIEAEILQEQVTHRQVNSMFWKQCRSARDLKTDTCGTFWLSR